MRLGAEVGVDTPVCGTGGVDTPVCGTLYAALLPSELKARGDLPDTGADPHVSSLFST